MNKMLFYMSIGTVIINHKHLDLIIIKQIKVFVINVVDGQHRLKALYRFINNKFRLNNLKLLNGLDGKEYKDLDGSLKS